MWDVRPQYFYMKRSDRECDETVWRAGNGCQSRSARFGRRTDGGYKTAMNNRKKAEIRHEQIKNMLMKKEIVGIHEFCEKLKVSEATIRNDLTYLERAGILKRILGGAVLVEGTPKNTSYYLRSTLYQEEKSQIADYAVRHYIKEGMTVALDAGTTCCHIAARLAEEDISCSVITNSYSAAAALVKCPKIDLYLAGGRLDINPNSFHDEIALECIRRMYADVFFLGTDGIGVQGQITSSANDENIIKLAMMQQSKKTIVAADHSKFEKYGLKVLCSFDAVDRLITDGKIPDHVAKKVLENGACLEIAK